MSDLDDTSFVDVRELIKERCILELKVEKLKQLILLTDPVVSGDEVNEIAIKQWKEFTRCFPEEGP